MSAHDMKVCGEVEVHRHSFLTSAINGTGRLPNASVTVLREGRGPPVTVEQEVGYPPPQKKRTGLDALEKTKFDCIAIRITRALLCIR
jgi:hypothetical protein